MINIIFSFNLNFRIKIFYTSIKRCHSVLEEDTENVDLTDVAIVKAKELADVQDVQDVPDVPDVPAVVDAEVTDVAIDVD